MIVNNRLFIDTIESLSIFVIISKIINILESYTEL